MGKMKEVFMSEREFENNDHDDDAYFYQKWKDAQPDPSDYMGGDEDFVDFVDILPTVFKEVTETDDANEY